MKGKNLVSWLVLMMICLYVMMKDLQWLQHQHPSPTLSVLPSKNSHRIQTMQLLSFNPDLKLTSGIHLIVSFFRGTYQLERLQEILQVLETNLANPHIQAVHVLFEDVDPIEWFPNSLKLVRVNFATQPTYKDMFDYANQVLAKGTVVMIANSDIYFDESLHCLYNDTRLHLSTMLALSRHSTEVRCLSSARH
jgi:hypothetical protein